MKILIITAMFPPIQTGSSFYSKTLAESFTKKGHTVKLITTKNNQNKGIKYSFSVHRIPAIHIPIKNYFKHLRFCSLIPGNYLKVYRITREFSPDVILLVNHYLDIAFPAIFSAKRHKIPLFISVGTQMQSTNKIKNKILNILDRFIVGNLIFLYAKKIISWDKEIERYIKEVHNHRNASKSYIIPYGVNGDLSIYKGYIHNYNRIDQLVGIGAIIEQRNYLFQISVFKELLIYYPNLIFKIIGYEYINKSRKLVSELGINNNIIFTGELPHSEVLNELRKSFLGFTITSGHYTGLGTSTIETMLMGVPAISKSPQDLFGSNALLKDMENYIYTDDISVLKTVSKIKQLLDNTELREKIGIGGKTFVEKYMNWNNVEDKYIDLFKQELDEKK